MPTQLHPFSQLTTEEIKEAAQLLRKQYPEDASFVFKSITLEEPPKAAALQYLTAENTQSATRPVLDRQAFLAYYRGGNDRLHEAVINLTKQEIIYNHELDRGMHGQGDIVELMACEKTVYQDARFPVELKKIGIDDPSLVVVEPWIYGSDGVNDDDRQFQCFLFLKDPQNPDDDGNHYARPLPLSPVVDVKSWKVVRFDWLPTGADNKTGNPRYVIPPPNEYVSKYQELRTDLKPLMVQQPAGASFTVTEDFACSHLIEWQKWRLRVGFNAREGMVLYDVRYDGRPLFYRVSLSDMNIPYADPRHPFHKKAAFDLGDAGAGYTANSLKLGCDCLGSIVYISATLADSNAKPMLKENCICIHEQDNGIGWKHTNYRTENAVVTRARSLVFQSIMTVANYEYILAFMFNQAGELTYEVRATGIVSTQPIDLGVKVPWGTIVHPGVLASHHQHIFSLRIDPNIDGPGNTLYYEEALAMPRSEHLNPYGTGYYSEETEVTVAGGYDLNTQTNRTFKIKNPKKLNPVNDKSVAYKIMVSDFQKILADKDSWHYKRSEFADHNIYVTKYRADQRFPAGQYTNQSRGGNGVRKWAAAGEAVIDDDIVVWVQFGMNHIPRIEDFPVMPVETLQVHLKPDNFFTKNPALDVPPPVQSRNQSCELLVRNGVQNIPAYGLNGCT